MTLDQINEAIERDEWTGSDPNYNSGEPNPNFDTDPEESKWDPIPHTSEDYLYGDDE